MLNRRDGVDPPELAAWRNNLVGLHAGVMNLEAVD